MHDIPTRTKPDLTALLGSRICHDLVSPLGAIGNGVELLAMSGPASPEMAMIEDSVRNANARIRFFRLAFGPASPDQSRSRTETLGILTDYFNGGRLRLDWQIDGDPPHGRVKLAFLAIQCLETAMPYGGQITVTQAGTGWQVVGENPKIRVEPGLWQALHDPDAPHEITPAQIQFALLPDEAARQGLHLRVEARETRILIEF